MVKRGQSNLSLLLGVNKPSGITSHDVVNNVRYIFSERRVGHGGTLDPMTTGAMYVMVGCATRLDNYLACEDKCYIATISFGFSTTTDDSEGDVLERSRPSSELSEETFANAVLNRIKGESMQLPPVYSAIKIDGKKSYEQARRGNILDLKPRRISINDTKLLSIDCADDGSSIEWVAEFDVSKGTYIRSIARDLGKSLGCPAHLKALSRIRTGRLEISDCYTLDDLRYEGMNAALDPVVMLGLRFFFVDSLTEKLVNNGNVIDPALIELYDYSVDPRHSICSCTSGVVESDLQPADGELFCSIAKNKLKAIYRFDAQKNKYVPDCVFQIGVSRGFSF